MGKKPKCISLAVSNMKGGVGKTITAVSIASNFAEKGFKTLLIDADFQANASDYLGLKYQGINNKMTLYHGIGQKRSKHVEDIIQNTKFDNLDMISSSLELSQFNEAEQSPYKLKKWLSKDIIEEYDYIIIDTRPELGHLFKNVMSYVDYYLVPIFAEADAISGLRIMFNKLKEIQEDFNPNIRLAGTVITRFDKKNHTHNRFKEVIEELGQESDIPCLGDIPVSNAIATSVDMLTPLPFYRMNNKIPARDSYLELTDKLLKILIKRKGKAPRIPDINNEIVDKSINDMLLEEELTL